MQDVDMVKIVENIYAIAKERNIRIGSLEADAGVSTGYLSRFLKPSGGIIKMSAESLIKFAGLLGMTVDEIINYNTDTRVPMERKIDMFLSKVTRDTENNVIRWDRFTNMMPALCSGQTDMVYDSKFLDKNIMVRADFKKYYYSCDLGNFTALYLVPVEYLLVPGKFMVKSVDGWELLGWEHSVYPICNGASEIAEMFKTKLVKLSKLIKERVEGGYLRDEICNFLDRYLDEDADKTDF